jgi:uncharacterized protein YacL
MEQIALQVVIIAALLLNPLVIIYLLRRSGTVAPAVNATDKRKIVVDTCALIDGRLIEVMRAGFVPGQLLIPEAVIAELQHLADKADPYKRERARFGLDIVKELQSLSDNGVVILPNTQRTEQPVDDMLVDLAQKHSAMLYTTDFNLNKVAEIKGVRVLNVNELAQGLRARYLPGETITVKLVQKGQDQSQGVGYMPDGTMVVVENAGKLINQTVTVTFSRMLQTQAGKMMFAKLASQPRTQKAEPTRETGLPLAKKTPSKSQHVAASKSSRPDPTAEQSARPKGRRSRKSPEDSLLESVEKYAR